MEIEVVPDALSGAGAGLRGTGAQVEAAGAFEDLASSWTGAIGRSADGVSGLGATMEGAAALYRITDLLAIP